MAEHCPDAVPLALGRLRGWQWQINARGYANVVPVPPEDTAPSARERIVHTAIGDSVYGMLYRLTREDEKRLDQYEGVGVFYGKTTPSIEVLRVAPQRQSFKPLQSQSEPHDSARDDAQANTQGSRYVSPAPVGGPSRTAGPSRSALPPGYAGGLAAISQSFQDVRGSPNDPPMADGQSRFKVPTVKTLLPPTQVFKDATTSPQSLFTELVPGTEVTAVIYVDTWRTKPDKAWGGYINRINQGINESRKWGLPEIYVSEVLRKYIPDPKDRNAQDYARD